MTVAFDVKEYFAHYFETGKEYTNYFSKKNA
jgi:hypothetical protein